jgi:ParB family chromosome partitioning protein
VKRRLALASLAPEAKKALRDGTITRSIAEVLTIGSHARQRSILEGILQYEDEPDTDDIRRMLLCGKPSVAMAMFPREQYTGAIATDLFADDETTYFEDCRRIHPAAASRCRRIGRTAPGCSCVG